MLIAAGIAAVGAGLSQWLAPETKGKSLTETAAAWCTAALWLWTSRLRINFRQLGPPDISVGGSGYNS